jgi:hypothetical protein
VEDYELPTQTSRRPGVLAVHLLRYEKLPERWSSLSSISERYDPTDFTKNKSMTAPEEIKDKLTSKSYTRNKHLHRQGEIYNCTGKRIEALVLSQRFKCMSCGQLIDRYIYPRGDMLPEWFRKPGYDKGTSGNREGSKIRTTANNRSMFESAQSDAPRAITSEDSPQQIKIECNVK